MTIYNTSIREINSLRNYFLCIDCGCYRLIYSVYKIFTITLGFLRRLVITFAGNM